MALNWPLAPGKRRAGTRYVPNLEEPSDEMLQLATAVAVHVSQPGVEVAATTFVHDKSEGLDVLVGLGNL
jgi:hypothetical protein